MSRYVSPRPKRIFVAIVVVARLLHAWQEGIFLQFLEKGTNFAFLWSREFVEVPAGAGGEFNVPLLLVSAATHAF
jgi:hypothetical protein